MLRVVQVTDMKLPGELKGELERELRFASDKIIAEKDSRRKLFFYSATHGVTRRIMNLHYDPQLAFMDLVLEVTYNTINNRVNRIVVENDNTIPLIDGLFEKLAGAVKDLADCVKNDEDTYKVLEAIVSLAHTTTGNGYYLFTKGLVKV